MLQTVIGIRLTVRGDGKSKRLCVNLRDTPVYFVAGGTYGLMDRIPDEVLRITAGGPEVLTYTNPFVDAKLTGDFLILDFDFELKRSEEYYTFELYFGYNSSTPPSVSMSDAVMQVKPDGIRTSPPDSPHGFSA